MERLLTNRVGEQRGHSIELAFTAIRTIEVGT
jgi:hypothetical protein